MNLTYLTSFVLIAELGSYTKAADHLYISQPALSRHIAILEKELGTTLFTRDKRINQVQLTESGKVLLEEGRKLLEQAREVENKVHQTAAGLQGTLSLVSFIPDFFQILDVWFEFRKQYPNVAIDFQNHIAPKTITKGVANGRHDMGVLYRFELNDSPEYSNEFEKIWLYHDRLVLVVPQEHRLLEKERVSLDDLKHEKFIFFDDFGRKRNEYLQLDSRYVSGEQQASAALSPFSAYMEVLQKKGLIFIPGMISSTLPAELRHIQVDEQISGGDTMDVFLIWRKDNKNPVLVRFLELLRALTAKE